MKQFIIAADVFVGKEKFCSVEREIWAATPNAAKMEFLRTNAGGEFSVIRELRLG